MTMKLTRSVHVWLIVAIMPLVGSVATAEHSFLQNRPIVDPQIVSYASSEKLSGAIAIAGSDTMQPIIARIASSFKQWHPDVKIAVQGGGSDVALRAFVQDIAASRRGDGNVRGHLSANDLDILASSRRLTPDELKEFRARHGYEPLELPVALDAVAIYVNRTNPIQGLTMEQVDAIFGSVRKRGLPNDLATWGELGLQNGWEQLRVTLFGRDKRSGTRTFFIQEALLGGSLKPHVREEPGPAMEILDIGKDPAGIGYAGIGFHASTVRILPLAEKAGKSFVFPTAESSANGTYPLARLLYLYVSKAPNAKWERETLEFLKFINSREGQDSVVKAGVFPLPAAQVQTNLIAMQGDSFSATAPSSTMATELKP